MKIAVTGAFSYSGKHITQRLLARGEEVITLTGHPNRTDPFGGKVRAYPLDFEVAGMTRPGALADWFSKAGFRDVRNVTNVFFNKGRGTLDEVRSLHDKGYRVCLFIGAKMLDAVKQKKGTVFADHWTVLTKIVRISDTIELELYTWGNGHYRVPQGGTLTAAKFYDNFYGYVAAKP